MAVGGLFKYAQRALFSKPTPRRRLIKLAKQHPVRRVVEVGVESIDGTVELLRALVKQARGEAVDYTAIDPFEERPPAADRLSLVEAYRRVAATGARVRLVPGALGAGVAGEANALADTDLLLLSAAATDEALRPAWFYLPRMCHPGTRVFRGEAGPTEEDGFDWTPIPLEDVVRRASGAVASRAA